ncbi:MAG: FHA domain-containing protein [Anaerolineae bacterium]|nr:FHA domain-containing protein [Anaerolineae bacterium]
MQTDLVYRLVEREGPKIQRQFVLSSSAITLGRDLAAEIVLDDPQVARHHARLTYAEAGYFISDLNSPPATFVNGQPVPMPRPLKHGDVIRLGESLELVYEILTTDQFAAEQQAQPLQQAVKRVVRKKRGYRSPFWLILTGGLSAVYIAGAIGLIPPMRLITLLSLWPLIAAAIIIDLVLGRISWILGGVFGLLTVCVLYLLTVTGPQKGWVDASGTEVFGVQLNTLPESVETFFNDFQPPGSDLALSIQSARFYQPAVGIETAYVELGLGRFDTMVGALPEGVNIVEANVYYLEDFIYDVQEGSDRSVTIAMLDNDSPDIVMPIGVNRDLYRWVINFDPAVALNLTITLGEGAAEIDLSGLDVASLTVYGGEGAALIALPADLPVRFDLPDAAADRVTLPLSYEEGAGEDAVPVTVESVGEGTIEFVTR